MSLELDIYYRGPLASCNYACRYCPFAKTTDSAASMARDAAALECFVGWIESRPGDVLGVMFTPWGEALIRRHYREAIVRLSRLPQVRRVGVQTNLSVDVEWVAQADRERLALWCSYHPTQVAREAFLRRCRRLEALGVRFSVGMVGLREQLDEIEELRRLLPSHVYLWVNAYKDVPNYYDAEDVRRLQRVDPWFHLNAERHFSLGQACGAGQRSILVDGRGDVRRCHFVEQPIGNLYSDALEGALRERPCPRATCGCYIGYVHLDRLALDRVYGSSKLERIPIGFASRVDPGGEA